MTMQQWMDARVARLNWMDIGLLTIRVIAFALMIAKLWPVILTPHWAIFAFLFLLAYGPLKQIQIGILTEQLAAAARKKRKPKQKKAGWLRGRMDNLNSIDIAMVKVSAMIAALLVAKYWSPLLTPDWKIFGAIFLVTYIPLAVKLLIRQD